MGLVYAFSVVLYSYARVRLVGSSQVCQLVKTCICNALSLGLMATSKFLRADGKKYSTSTVNNIRLAGGTAVTRQARPDLCRLFLFLFSYRTIGSEISLLSLPVEILPHLLTFVDHSRLLS